MSVPLNPVQLILKAMTTIAEVNADAVIATQLTATSKHGHQYTADFASQLSNLYEDCISGTPTPKKVATSLIKDEQYADGIGNDLLPA